MWNFTYCVCVWMRKHSDLWYKDTVPKQSLVVSGHFKFSTIKCVNRTKQKKRIYTIYNWRSIIHSTNVQFLNELCQPPPANKRGALWDCLLSHSNSFILISVPWTRLSHLFQWLNWILIWVNPVRFHMKSQMGYSRCHFSVDKFHHVHSSEHFWFVKQYTLTILDLN